jgi:hypothetical protein
MFCTVMVGLCSAKCGCFVCRFLSLCFTPYVAQAFLNDFGMVPVAPVITGITFTVSRVLCFCCKFIF